MSGKPKASGASAQILSTNQEILELCKNTNERVTDLEARLKDTTMLLETLGKKLDNTRLAATSKSRGGSVKASGKKEENKKTAAPINLWFRQKWKADPEGTIEKYCDADAVDAVEAEVKKNPAHAKKVGDALNYVIAGQYYQKYLAKPGDANHQERREQLRADHTAMKEALEKGEDVAGDDGDDGED